MTSGVAAKPAINISPAQAWARALKRTASIARNPERIFPVVIEEHAARSGDTPALLSERECFSYRQLVHRANQYSRWALAQAIAKGECVGLLMPNCPEYLAAWLGISQAGGVVALLNTNLAQESLAHSIHLVAPKHVIAADELADRVAAQPVRVWPEREVHSYDGETLGSHERRPVNIYDRALYIYTSGTTGLPKAAAVSHGRVMQWTHWFAGLMDTTPEDRLYNCLPMYHSVGGVLAPGAVLASGGSVVLRDKFSGSQFWDDVLRWDCTLIQYIGELCRYLLSRAPSRAEKEHRIRMACGNGLRADIWEAFQQQFRIPQILEFYAATEGNVSLFNVENEPGAIGRVPSYLAHRFPSALIQFDVEQQTPVRDSHGLCIRCGPDEVGEAIGQLSNDPSNIGGRFEGYTSPEASEKKILRNVFKAGDAWFRTGDLMRQDARGFFYFVDRIGDTFRWKGENVSTLEVSEALCSFPGVKEAIVYGVEIPGADGRTGMAAVVAGDDLDVHALREHFNQRLPHYARPTFLRIRDEMEVTGTFKYTKTELARQGYDPALTSDKLFYNHPLQQAVVPIDDALYGRIRTERILHASHS